MVELSCGKMLPRVEMVKQKGLKSQSASLQRHVSTKVVELSSSRSIRGEDRPLQEPGGPDAKEPRLCRRTPITKSKAEKRSLPQFDG